MDLAEVTFPACLMASCRFVTWDAGGNCKRKAVGPRYDLAMHQRYSTLHTIPHQKVAFTANKTSISPVHESMAGWYDGFWQRMAARLIERGDGEHLTAY